MPDQGTLREQGLILLIVREDMVLHVGKALWQEIGAVDHTMSALRK